MKTILATLAILAAGSLIGPLAAKAHISVPWHPHPHAHQIETALLGLDTLALVALGLAVAVGAGSMLARRLK